MENASKALIMAGGMLLAILMISLLIYAWSLFSEYQASKDSLAEIEDTAKFNEQFTAYDRDDVKGYELLSLVNQVIDYNYRMSSVTGAKNDEKYEPITITINLDDNKSLTPDGGTNKLFMITKYTQNNTNNVFKKIISEASSIETEFGNVDSAVKVAKGYKAIFINSSNVEEWKKAAIKFSTCVSNKTIVENIQNKINAPGLNGKNIETYINTYKDKAAKYYEYNAFKSSKFASDDNIEYSNVTGRVKKMSFKKSSK